MNKSLSRWLFLFGLLVLIIGGCMVAYGFSGDNILANGVVMTSHITHLFWVKLGAIIAGIGYLLGLIAWMGAVARTAQLARWIWFVCLIILPLLGMLCYIFFGPRSPSRRARRAVSTPPPTPSYGY